MKFCQCFGLHLVNEFPTRGQSLLDLILTNDPLIMSEINLKPPFSSSDHDSLTADVIVCLSNLTYDVEIGMNKITDISMSNNRLYNWFKADWVGCAEFFSKISWQDMFKNCDSSNDLWEAFKEALHSGLSIFVPLKQSFISKSNVNSKKKMHPKKIVTLLNKKKALWKACKKNNSVTKKQNTSSVLN